MSRNQPAPTYPVLSLLERRTRRLLRNCWYSYRQKEYNAKRAYEIAHENDKPEWLLRHEEYAAKVARGELPEPVYTMSLKDYEKRHPEVDVHKLTMKELEERLVVRGVMQITIEEIPMAPVKKDSWCKFGFNGEWCYKYPGLYPLYNAKDQDAAMNEFDMELEYQYYQKEADKIKEAEKRRKLSKIAMITC